MVKSRICIFWDVEVWDVNLVDSSSQHITVGCSMKNGGMAVFISVIYGSNSFTEREALWRELKNLSSAITGPWIAAGDFNTIRQREVYSHGPKGRLVLINDDWMQQYPNSWVDVKPAGVSDHSALVVTVKSFSSWGPKPFKFFNLWTEKPDFLNIVRNAWAENVVGHPMFVMVTKLKHVKAALKGWDNSIKDRLTQDIQTSREILSFILKEIQAHPFEISLVESERLEKVKLGKLLNEEEKFHRQKARVLWLADGDRNTKFFHSAFKRRCASNSIHTITLPNGISTEDMNTIKEGAVSHFTDIFNRDNLRDSFHDVHFKRVLTEDARNWLSRPVQRVELKYAIKGACKDKAPGSDGFNACFYKKAWKVIKYDLWKAVANFFETSVLIREVNHTFIALIPKEPGAKEFKSYRPIALCNFLYKLITKILARRLQVVLGGLISPNQMAFIKGRRILDNILLAHELVRGFNRVNSPKRACMKVDIIKAYDMVNRKYVLHLLRCLGFGEIWIGWIQACILAPTFFILLNGSPNGFIHSNCGLRQGDPISPYLFTIVMEALSLELEKGLVSGKWCTFQVGRSLKITHLAFADDLLVFLKPTLWSCKGIVEIFSHFANSSGLSISLEKSSIFFSRGCTGTQELSNELGIPIGSLPVRYLGLPLFSSKLLSSICAPLIEKVKLRVESWSSRLLSYAGRLELVRSVLVSTGMFWCLAFKLPQGVCKKVECIFADYLWGKKSHMVKWKDLCLPKGEGGLGIRRLVDINLAGTIKQAWLFLTDRDSLWARWMRLRYLRNSNFWNTAIHRKDSIIWKCILESRTILAANSNPQTADIDHINDIQWNMVGGFSLAGAWDLVRNRAEKVDWGEFIWKAPVHPQWQWFGWMACVGRIKTQKWTQRIGISLANRCVLCEVEEEDVDHLFFSCRVTVYLWNCCRQRLGLCPVMQVKLLEEISFLSYRWARNKVMLQISQVALLGVLWSCWRERNERIHDGAKTGPLQLRLRIDGLVAEALESLNHSSRVSCVSRQVLERWRSVPG